MRFRAVLCAACVAALLIPARLDAARVQRQYRVGLILHDNVTVRSRSSPNSPVLAVLVQQTQVEVLGQHGSWSHVLIWASVAGWVKTREIVFRRPWSSVSTYRPPEIRYYVHAYPPRRVRASAITTGPVLLRRAPGGTTAGSLATGSRVQVTAWQQDAAGKIWYQVGHLWALGDALLFQGPDPAKTRSHGEPLWSPVTGKGMWLTLGTIASSDPDALVRAALHTGLTHLYLEAAISPLGFHGKDTVGHLIDAAHQSHLAVIAWVYPYLYDVASDVALTEQVARFQTPGGNRFDGIAADLERNVQDWNVRAYSQLVRSALGPRYLLVGVTYPPQAFPSYPFAEVAHQYNIIAPMDYWHQTKTRFGLDYGALPYGYVYGYRYARDSVTAIRRVRGDVAVAPIGQTFDNFGHLEMGPYAPSAQEVKGFLAGSKSGGSVGASFFQWMTATDDEWHAIHDYRF